MGTTLFRVKYLSETPLDFRVSRRETRFRARFIKSLINRSSIISNENAKRKNTFTRRKNVPLLEEPNMVRAFAKDDELVVHKKLALMIY